MRSERSAQRGRYHIVSTMRRWSVAFARGACSTRESPISRSPAVIGTSICPAASAYLIDVSGSS